MLQDITFNLRFYVPFCRILYGKTAMAPVIYEIKSSVFFATSSGVVRLYSPLFIIYLSCCVSVCVSVTGHQTLKFKQKNRIVTDIQTESELSNWNKKVNYIVELFLKMLQKTGTFYYINYGRHCSFSIEYPTKWHIKTNNVRKI